MLLPHTTNAISYNRKSAVLIIEDDLVLWGYGIGSYGKVIGELCFNTSMTGYQEIITDPSYAGQIITFTFPHIGNVGTNDDDLEGNFPVAKGCIFRQEITQYSNYRSQEHLYNWMKQYNLIGLTGVDTRRLTKFIRDKGAPKALLIYQSEESYNIDLLKTELQNWSSLEDTEKNLLTNSHSIDSYNFLKKSSHQTQYKVIVIDYGVKRSILLQLSYLHCEILVVSCDTSAEKILDLNPDGILLSNGPGDPNITGEYAIPIVKKLINSEKPIFGICLGHQIMALALGGKTIKMQVGHRGSNHPIKNLETGRVEITTQNHGFAVKKNSLPDSVKETHLSLFDGTIAGIHVKDKPIFAVQYHPEASPGPHDSHYLFKHFIKLMKSVKNK